MGRVLTQDLKNRKENLGQVICMYIDGVFQFQLSIFKLQLGECKYKILPRQSCKQIEHITINRF